MTGGTAMTWPAHVRDLDWLKARVTVVGECWEWNLHRNERGYGKYGVETAAGHRTGRAHRLAFEIANGRPPGAGLDVRHECDNPPCCNPAHLVEGTHRGNLGDMALRGRTAGAKLTAAETRAVAAALVAGRSGASLAREYGVSESTVSDIRYGRRRALQGAS